MKKNMFKTIIFVLSGSIMMAHGARMIYQGLFQKGSYYIPNTFDILFDWTTLFILGAIVFYLAITNFYQNLNKTKKTSTIKPQ